MGSLTLLSTLSRVRSAGTSFPWGLWSPLSPPLLVAWTSPSLTSFLTWLGFPSSQQNAHETLWLFPVSGSGLAPTTPRPVPHRLSCGPQKEGNEGGSCHLVVLLKWTETSHKQQDRGFFFTLLISRVCLKTTARRASLHSAGTSLRNSLTPFAFY